MRFTLFSLTLFWSDYTERRWLMLCMQRALTIQGTKEDEEAQRERLFRTQFHVKDKVCNMTCLTCQQNKCNIICWRGLNKFNNACGVSWKAVMTTPRNQASCKLDFPWRLTQIYNDSRIDNVCLSVATCFSWDAWNIVEHRLCSSEFCLNRPFKQVFWLRSYSSKLILIQNEYLNK